MHIARAESRWSALPSLLSATRIVLGPLYVLMLEVSCELPLAVAVIAAVSDFVDGRLARRLGSTSRRGAVLDVVGDGVFVVCALAALAAVGLVSRLLPAAVLLALAGLAIATLRGTRPAPGSDGVMPRRGPADRAGHLAGVANYAIVLAASGALAGLLRASWLLPVSVAVACLNVAPVVLRATLSRYDERRALRARGRL
ncbi:MAG: CDP-alcohol phosphatidyltransferase family protein [Thermodesulfobacteriota bacterium]